MTLLKSHGKARIGARTHPAPRVRQGRTTRRMSMTSTHPVEEQVLWPVVILHNVDSSWTEAESRSPKVI